MAVLIEGCKPFKVRASCGHIVIRKMREATAGVPYTDETVLDAPNGRACDECEAWAEYQHAADDLARSGRSGAIGDPLPQNMSVKAVQFINDDPEAFEREVRRCKYARAMAGVLDLCETCGNPLGSGLLHKVGDENVLCNHSQRPA